MVGRLVFGYCCRILRRRTTPRDLPTYLHHYITLNRLWGDILSLSFMLRFEQPASTLHQRPPHPTPAFQYAPTTYPVFSTFFLAPFHASSLVYGKPLCIPGRQLRRGQQVWDGGRQISWRVTNSP